MTSTEDQPVDRHAAMRTALITAARAGTASAAVPATLMTLEPRITRDGRFLDYCDPEAATVEWPEMIENGGWSSTQLLLLKAAAFLAGARGIEINLNRAMERLDERQADILDQMLVAHHTGKLDENLVTLP